MCARGDSDMQGSHKAPCDETEWRLMGARRTQFGKVEVQLLGDLWTYSGRLGPRKGCLCRSQSTLNMWLDGKGMAFPPDFELSPTKSPGQKAPGSGVTMGASRGVRLHSGSLLAGLAQVVLAPPLKSSLTGR